MAAKKGLFLSVDLGGTNIQAAAVRKGKILISKKTNTQAKKGSEVVIDRIEKVLRQVMGKIDKSSSDFEALCIGAPRCGEPRDRHGQRGS